MTKYLKRWREKFNSPAIDTLLLYAGALLGLFFALASILIPGPSVFLTDQPDVIVTVNGAGILRSRYVEQLDAVRADRRDELTNEIKERVLNRLIEEELLIQNGLDIGFARSDRGVRSALVNGVIATILTEVEAVQPTRSQLEVFYEENRYLFQSEDRVVVRRIIFDQSADEPPVQHAARVMGALNAGQSFQKVSYGLPAPTNFAVPIPEGALSLTELRKYIGPSAVKKIGALREGGYTELLAMERGVQVFFLEKRLPGKIAAFEESQAVVRQAYRQAAGARALNDYLALLREQAKISVPD